MRKQDKEDLLALLAFVGVISSIIAFIFGGIAGIGETKCKIDSTIKLHPGFIIGCELTRKREW